MGEPIDGEPFGYTVETGDHNPATPWGSCNKVAMMGPRQGASDKFYVRDASMYSAHLYVRDDFGCVEWEQVKR